MIVIPNEWVEAGARALHPEFDGEDEATSAIVLAAALPLIRKSIAEDIKANLTTSHRTEPDPYDPNDYYGGVAIHSHDKIISDAINIVLGK